MSDYSILVGGAAGQGSRKAGLLIAKLFNQYGYRIFIYDDYQSLIKGGHNFSVIRASDKDVLAHQENIDFLLALDKNTLKKHQKKLKKTGLIIYDLDKISEVKGIGVPLKKITQAEQGLPIMENVALVAGFAKVVGIEWRYLKKLLQEEFQEKAEINLRIAKRAYEESPSFIKIKKLNQKPLPLLTGNEAVALGAVKAGLDMYFAYPMTPASSILHYLAEKSAEFNVATSQLENEIAVINTAIGAAFAGARTMVGTSGGGFALMTEGLSLAAQSETPVVIVESQRMSPATGVPTYTEQADLLFCLSAGHGDFSRFVIAPGDAEEAFYFAGKALNLAWKYQTPSILLIDKEISESTFSFHPDVQKKIKKEEPLLWKSNKNNYQRYHFTKDGISPLAFPGQKNVVVKATSYEHDEKGITVEEDEKMIKKMQEKRLKKFEKMKKAVEKLEAVKIYGKKNSSKSMIVWGSTKGPAKEAAEKLGIKLIQLIVIEPFPEKQMKEALRGVRSKILVETNASAQMEKVLNCYGIRIDKKILKYNGRPFTAEEIEKKLKISFLAS